MSGNPPKQEVPFIEIEKLIASKNPRLLRIIPGFLMRYLKRVIHEDQINDAMLRLRDLHGLEFIGEILKEFGVDIKVSGQDYLRQTTRCLVASNHPLGGLDGMALMKVAGEVHPDIVFPVNDLLMNLPNIRELFIPINKHGSNAQNIQLMDATFASEKTILYFPAGLCSRKIRGEITDLEWKKTFISKTRKYKRDIVPTHIEGKNSSFFYNLAGIRKSLGIKANIEMIYLPDEMFRQKDKTLIITFGKPLPWSGFTRDKTDLQWATLVKEHVYRLGKGVDDFDGLIHATQQSETLQS